MGDLDGKVALVTEATTGIRRATAETFLDRGVVAFLASDASACMRGAEMPVDGGRSTL